MNNRDWFDHFLSPERCLEVQRCQRYSGHPDWRIVDRVIPDHILYVVLQGSIAARIDGKAERWETGQAAWVGPGIRQYAEPGGDMPLRFFVLRVFIGKQDGEALAAPSEPLLQEMPAGLLSCLDECADLHVLPGELQRVRFRCRLAEAFALMLEQGRAQRRPPGLHAHQRQALQAWFMTHLAEAPSAQDLARVAEVSPATFRRRFQVSFGCSPREWISQERLRQASELLLEGGGSVQQVALECGYESLPSFTRLFSRRFGCSPASWRERAGRNPVE